jgi:hypothetical protein
MPDPGSCPNCGRRHEVPRTPFCPGCGQETALRPPTLGEFAQQFGGSYLSTEGALWRTFRLLLTRPGALTREYLAGRRRHYVLPLRLYLTASVAALVALRVAGSGAMVQLSPETAAELARAGESELVIAVGGEQGPRLGLANGKFFCEHLPAAVCRHVQRKLDLDPKAMSRELERASERFVGHWGTAMFLLVPMFALWCKLAWLNRRLRYTEHLVYALHLHAFWFAAIAIGRFPLPLLEPAAMLAMPVYAVLASRRVYGGRWWPTMLRNAGVAIAYGMTLVVALGVVSLWAFLG